MVAATGGRISLSFAAPRLLIPASTARAFATASAFFPDIDKVRYEGPSSRNPLAFKQYAEDEVVAGRTMKEWLRFSIAYWHTWRGNGGDIFGLDGTINRPWEDRALRCVLTSRLLASSPLLVSSRSALASRLHCAARWTWRCGGSAA